MHQPIMGTTVEVCGGLSVECADMQSNDERDGISPKGHLGVAHAQGSDHF